MRGRSKSDRIGMGWDNVKVILKYIGESNGIGLKG